MKTAQAVTIYKRNAGQIANNKQFNYKYNSV